MALGSMVVFTALIGRWGDWRLRRATAKAEVVADAGPDPDDQVTASHLDSESDPQLVAAISAAVALAVESYRRERETGSAHGGTTARPDGDGWREQGRIVAFDSRRIRERDR